MEPFLASIEAMAFNFPPKYWAVCDGSQMPISQNSAVYALLGTSYGGDGRSYFNLPDMRGRTPMGQGIGPGLSPRYMGDKFGTETATLMVANMPPHEHLVSLGGTASGSGGTMAAAGSGAVNPMPSGVAGSGQPFSVMPPTLVVNFLIALNGVFPSRY